MFFKKVFVPWLLLFTTVSPNIGWVLAGVSKADYHTEPSFLRNKISTEEMGPDEMFACVWERTAEVLLDEKDKMSRGREGGRLNLAWAGKRAYRYWALSSVISAEGDRHDQITVLLRWEKLTRRHDHWTAVPVTGSHTHTHLGEGLLPNSTLTMEFLSVLFKQKLKSI